MAQFDVYPNPNPAYRSTWPWVVDVQHETLSSLQTRLTIPLAQANPANQGLPKRLFPRLEFQGASYTLLAQVAAPVHISRLKSPQGTLRERSAEIQASLDAVMAGV
jgi:toxin CcdB